MNSETFVFALTRPIDSTPAAIAALGAHLINVGPFSLVCGRPDEAETMASPARALAMRQYHARLLELLLEADMPVLATDRPAAIEDRHALAAALKDAEPLLSHSLEQYGRKVEFEIVVAVDPQRLVEGLSLAGRLHDLNGLPADELASTLEARLRGHRDELGQEALAQLSMPGATSRRGPGMAAEIILHAWVMGERTIEPELDRVLEALDRRHDGRHDIRCLGPLPPRSFVALSLEEISAEQLVAARASLGLDAQGLSEAVIEDAFRRRVRTIHPDSLAAVKDATSTTGAKGVVLPNHPAMDVSLGALKAARDLVLLDHKRSHGDRAGWGLGNLVRLALVTAPELDAPSIPTAA